MPTLKQNHTGKRYVRRLGLCDCGMEATRHTSSGPACARCVEIERVLYPRRSDRGYVDVQRFGGLRTVRGVSVSSGTGD